MSEIEKMFLLKDKTALVTGGAGLLGAEFCRVLAQAGANVVVADLDFDAAFQVTAHLLEEGYDTSAQKLNVADKLSVEEVIRTSVEMYGSLDVLVNSAALDPKFDPENKSIQTNAFEDYPLDAWKQALDVNLTGMFLCCQAAANQMLEQGGGVIINISSMYGVVAPDQRLYEKEGQPKQFKPVTYTVTKAGVLGMTKYLASYYGKQNIRVNTLTPGGVFNQHEDDFVEAYSARSVMGRMAEKDEMNGALLFLASDASKHMTGANLIVDGGWTAW